MVIERILSRRLGCEIEMARSELLSGRHSRRLRELLVEHGVLVLTGVHLNDDEQLAFAGTLGSVASDWDVSADRSVNANARLADYQRSSVFWHFDGFGVRVPEFATLMSPRSLEHGSAGATEFANCYAAYDELGAEDQALIDQLKVLHSFENLMRLVRPWPEYAELKAWQEGGHTHVHPLVWQHASGRKSLLLGGSAAGIVGMDDAAGRLLICRLHEWATRPENVFRYDWKLGDLVIWDNTGTLHRAVPYETDNKRLMHRTTILGEETPVSPTSASGI